MRPGEIYLAKFPFGDAPGMKIRPVLILIDPTWSAVSSKVKDLLKL
jgi:hypothetical protein